MNIEQIQTILEGSPSIRLIRSKNAALIIAFLFGMFKQDNRFAVAETQLLGSLADYLQQNDYSEDEEDEITVFDDYEAKARKLLQKWTDSEYLRNYHDDQGTVLYELTSDAEKALEWLASLEKREFVGAESRFKSIFNKLKELVEFCTIDKEQRLRELEQRKQELEAEIQRIEITGEVLIYDDYQIKERIQEITQTAKELLVDFREVEENFKTITRQVYQKHTDPYQTKGGILAYAFDALDELKETEQGRSFYAFWEFLIMKSRQDEWRDLVEQLMGLMSERHLSVDDVFLRKMKSYLHRSAQRVYESNDRMAEKLSRVILENERYERRKVKETIGLIKEAALKLAAGGINPEIGFTIEGELEISLAMERKISLERSELPEFTAQPIDEALSVADLNRLENLFGYQMVNRQLLERQLKQILKSQSQVSLGEVVARFPIEQGLAEIMTYFLIAKDRPGRAVLDEQEWEEIPFGTDLPKRIKIPQIIFMR
jgi:hypothetical protein